MNNTVVHKQEDGKSKVLNQGRRLVLKNCGGSYEVVWDPEAPVTASGSMVYFAQYLNSGGLLDELCQGSPLQYSSPNAPNPRDVFGTIIVSILNGQTRYAHMNALRQDRVSVEVLGMEKVVSEDSVRRALLRGEESTWDSWLRKQETAVYEPLLVEPYVLDIDSTVKVLYGHQEGAEVGYNPKKPGRPSHNYHTYFVGALRLVLGVDVQSGKKHSGGHGMPGLWAFIDRLHPSCRPSLIRGDVSYGNEEIMKEAEGRNQSYLFKLRQTMKVKDRIEHLEQDAGAWSDAGDGWQGTEQSLKLLGWTCPRRCIFLRRPAAERPATLPSGRQPEFEFIQVVPQGPCFEYIVLVTNSADSIGLLSQTYRDRADCENVFDEIKNQWGWAGFVTQDLRRCRIMARLIALIYNWWNVFTRLADPGKHMEAITSRPTLLQTIGRLTTSARTKTVHLTSTHAEASRIQLTLNRIAALLHRLTSTAEQLTSQAVWALILSIAFIAWLKGKPLQPVAHHSQLLFALLQ